MVPPGSRGAESGAEPQSGLDLWAGPRACCGLVTTQLPISFPLSEPTRKGMAQGRPRRSAQAPTRAAPGPPRGEETCLPLPLVCSMT